MTNAPRTRAWATAVAAARRRAAVSLPDGFARGADRLGKLLAQWIAAELAPGRLLPWLPVAYGAGIIVYFSAGHEPAAWAALALAGVTTAIAVAARHRAAPFALALGAAAMAAGFATATLQAARLAHPILRHTVASVAIEGFVEMREERERSDRITVLVRGLSGARMTENPQRVRVAVRKNTAPPVGSFVAFKARLSPPLAPLRPGGYDFARDMYFKAIGASGYALGRIRVATAPGPPGFQLAYAVFFDTVRQSIDRRIRAELPGDRGAIASALITGTRDAITAPVNDAMYVSGLAHVLSISGYHMAVVAGIVFFFVRAVLALVPALAMRRPIKKWAAAAALAAAGFYLLLSGAEVATQRSFIMIAIVLVGIMVDRPTLTFRTITVAAFAVLLLAPESIVQPSFQMSFAATLALIAGYQHGLPWHADRDSSFGARAALWGLREVVGLALASFVAGLATMPYAAFHFHRLAPYGVLANLLAMPVVSAEVMPMGILGVLAIPFGFDTACWRAMGEGIGWMITVVQWVAALPGAVGRMAAFGPGPLLLATVGLLLLCLLRTHLRWSGVAVTAVACLWAVAAPRPDVLVSADGQTAAIRGRDGRLALLHSGRDTFALKEWLAADADPRPPKDPTLGAGVRCDAIGCVGALRDGRLVAMPLAAEAFAEDCTRAAVVVSPRTAPGPCAARLVDRDAWRVRGAIALRWRGDGFEQEAARPLGYDRPWAPAAQQPSAPSRPAVRDAAPRAEDREADD